MSEDDPAENDDDRSRLQRLAAVFGNTTDDILLDSGLLIQPTNFRAGTYQIRHPEAGGIDVVDIEQFRSVRELHHYVRQFENTEEPPEDLGRGVA